ncbi:hypothetical protein COV42_00965 [Candidatus Campbellbacteria bacterium CG11_big_fil_rev_8_21_14_0_20_44_21]|uniref:Uncharacterized protein n=1 Tax=Candidatus Campbellbacteria bacterium CG22_combo_CG10-13_8_21_14_all_43_18 TaxID=1974530 RepID=A0A2H0DXX9_9BACT|nr:MAG: hypothetical protein COW82_02030 [Candidatus Campbellbacteria bacterium CG22_combo_CG10-13_8_21_14_all_43_18]PIR24396.1 MAG: hypothetical protein COV42_00965 [Candidatus Campbellbacteria bacterium CG11_big_fil_rev_8_21_14_0_20_44_21]
MNDNTGTPFGTGFLGQKKETMAALGALAVVVLAVLIYLVFLKGNGKSVEDTNARGEISEGETSGEINFGQEISSEIETRSQSNAAVPETNPIEQVKTNPFSDYKNPFE